MSSERPMVTLAAPAKPMPLWRRLIEPACFVALATALIVTVAAIAWRNHEAGKDVRVVQSNLPFRVNVNRAGEEELKLLPGVGAVRAARIVEARRKGRFANLEEFRTAAGMTPAQFESVSGLIKLEEEGK